MLVGQESTCWVQGRRGNGLGQAQERVGSGSRPGREQVALKAGAPLCHPLFSSLFPAPLNLHRSHFLLSACSILTVFISLLVCLSSSLDSLFQGGGE